MDLFAPGWNGPPPPAANSFINALRETTITSDDLIEENNKECLICLDDHELGGRAVKMPCGHLFHKLCLVEWLGKQGSCPACRYEVESSNAMYELSRKERMQKSRKMRMRKDELKAKSVKELRNMAHQLSINIAGCIDKSEITDIMSASGKIDFTEGVPVQKIEEDVFKAKSVKDLRKLLLSFGISDEGLLYKDELRDKLVESGRIELIESIGTDTDIDTGDMMELEVEEEAESEMVVEVFHEAACKMPATPSNTMGSEAAHTPVPAPDPNVLQLGPELVKSLSVRELKEIMGAYQINAEGCLERDDLLQRLSNHPGVSLMAEEW